MVKQTLTEEDASFIQSICRKSFERDKELGNDCFLYVWEKLLEDDSRRIKAFRGESGFRTFLYSVTGKLIIDFRRTRFGYKVLPKYFWNLDDINRHAFKLFFYQNLTSGWVENSICAEFKISRQEAERRVDEVEKIIRESRIKLESSDDKEPVFLGDEIDTIAAEDNRTSPEESIITAETELKREKVLKTLKEEIDKLDPEDALILQLYFEHELSAKEISGAIPGIKDKNVYKRIAKVLKNLGKYLRENGITDSDIKEIFERL